VVVRQEDSWNIHGPSAAGSASGKLRGTPGRLCSGCCSAEPKGAACGFSSGAAENGSHRRAEKMPLLCFALLVVVIHYISVYFSEIQVLFKTCLGFVGFKKAAHVRWQWVFSQ